uniref:hypothetical protein n=1 Tax=Singerocybe alboinfundibuliformis TaxID=1346812 RepID=UPI0030FE3C3F
MVDNNPSNNGKIPKKLRYLIVTLLVITMSYCLITYDIITIMYYYHKIKNIINLSHKYFTLPLFILLILYKLVYLFYLIDFSFKDEKELNIKINKYYPKFIKNLLIELKELSQSPDINFFIRMEVQFILIIFIMFIILLALFTLCFCK